MLVLSMILTLFPATASAADNAYYMFVGERGSMKITANQIPNAKWKTSNSSVLKIVKQSKTSVTTEGMKPGIAKLTVYNSKKASQKYTYTIKVVKERKLTKSDFILTTPGGSRSIFSMLSNSSISVDILTDNVKDLKKIVTYRGIHLDDSYSKVCARYGKKALKKTTTKDSYYKSFAKYATNPQYAAYKWVRIWKKQFKYYVDYFYNSHYKMRMYFNGSKKLVGIHFFPKDRF